jgi:hypothetical protein
MIRLCLIIAVIAGLAAAAVNFVKVKEVLTTTMQERDQNATDRDKEKAEKVKAQTDLASTKKDLDTTKATLDTTKKELDSATVKAAEQEKRATELAGQLEKTKADRDTAQQNLAAWDALGMPMDQVKGLIVDLKNLRQEKEAVVEENRVFTRRIKKLETDLAKYEGPDKPVALPTGLKGRILAVDPKYDFVLLDIGEKQGVLPRGKLLVNRNGKLVGKVQITTVEPDRSFANILPEWKNADIVEGDQVLY